MGKRVQSIEYLDKGYYCFWNAKLVEDIFPFHNVHTIAYHGPSIPHDLDDSNLVIPSSHLEFIPTTYLPNDHYAP